jgi:hypothetical protein
MATPRCFGSRHIREYQAESFRKRKLSPGTVARHRRPCAFSTSTYLAADRQGGRRSYVLFREQTSLRSVRWGRTFYVYQQGGKDEYTLFSKVPSGPRGTNGLLAEPLGHSFVIVPPQGSTPGAIYTYSLR